MTFEGAQPLTIRSAEDQVYEALRERIVRGLPPNAALRLNEIAESLAVSTMPVRTALRRLEAENLVVTQPRRGFFVAPLRVEDIEEIQVMRVSIEGLAARLGAPKVDDAGLKRMRELLTQLKRAVGKQDIDAYILLGAEFEQVCYDAVGWPRLSRLVDGMRRSAERYLRIAVGLGAEDLFISTYWDRFYESVEAHDGEATEEVLAEALMWTLERIRGHLDNAEQSNKS